MILAGSKETMTAQLHDLNLVNEAVVETYGCQKAALCRTG
jgi:hypothetical protein